MELWLTEENTPGYRVQWRIQQVLCRTKSRYQEIAIVDLEDFGRALVLDGIVQTTVADEFYYHEMIAHVPLCAHPDPRTVLVIGGGDGGTVREILKHQQVQRVVLVEIDAAVIEVCREYLPELSSGLDDPRVEIVVDDGCRYLVNCQDEFDLILVDSSDPIGPAVELFAGKFYQSAYRALKKDGILVAQTESPLFNKELFTRVVTEISGLFPITRPYLSVVPTYISGYWSYTAGSKKYNPENPSREAPTGLKFYLPTVHKAAFVLPQVVADLISGSKNDS